MHTLCVCAGGNDQAVEPAPQDAAVDPSNDSLPANGRFFICFAMSLLRGNKIKHMCIADPEAAPAAVAQAVPAVPIVAAVLSDGPRALFLFWSSHLA